MAEVKIADIYAPTTFAGLAQEAQIERNAFIASGIVVPDPIITRNFASGGTTSELPHMAGISIAEPNYSTDNPAQTATPGKISGLVQKMRIAPRNYHWTAMDLARDLALQDPVAAITNRIGHFWAVDDQKRLINSLLGVLADNVANDSGDMLHDIATDDVGAVADSERISSEAIAIATQTLGDAKMRLSAMAMHSTLQSRLARQGLIKEHRDNRNGELLFETYLGYRLIIDDGMPAVMGTNRITYTVAIFAPGAVGYGFGKVETPSALTRDELKGNGGGQSTLTSRVNTIFHPYGFAFESATITQADGVTASYSDLQLAANWNRVVNRKNVPIAFLQVND